MKKMITVILVLLLCLPAFALASTLTIDLSTATLDDLLQAQQQISDRISELHSASAPSADRIEFSGNGAAILSDVKISFSPSRIILQAEDRITATLTSGKHDIAIFSYDYKLYSLTKWIPIRS